MESMTKKKAKKHHRITRSYLPSNKYKRCRYSVRIEQTDGYDHSLNFSGVEMHGKDVRLLLRWHTKGRKIYDSQVNPHCDQKPFKRYSNEA